MEVQENRKENITLLEYLQSINENFIVEQEEKYSASFRGHYLKIITYIKDKETGERVKLKTHKVKIPKNVPRYITKNQLWHHTDIELKQLEILLKSKGEKEPTEETLKQWKHAIQLNVS